MVWVLGFKIQDLGFWAWSLRFGDCGLGLKVEGRWLRGLGFGFKG
jgi:hypothetical protein